MPLRFLLAFVLLWLPPQEGTSQADEIAAIVLRLQNAAVSADRAAVLAFGVDEAAVADLAVSLSEVVPSRVVLKERDRISLVGGGHRLLLELFTEVGGEGRLTTWGVDFVRTRNGWKIGGAVKLANVTGLYRLALNTSKQYDVRNLTVQSTDFTLHVPSGKAFVAETADGVTAVVLLGSGEMRFSPPDAAEQTQVRIFCGATALRTRFGAAFIRVAPSNFERRFPASSLIARTVAPGDLRRAEEIFTTYVGRTLQIDLGDLSRDRWSIAPQSGDFIAEVRTDRFGSLTYTRSGNEAEDITLFDRNRRRNISVYASQEKLAQRGRFYSEDDLVDYDVLAYEIDASIAPERFLIEGIARMKVKVRSAAASTLSLRLAEDLTVRGVYSHDYGRLLHLRVKGQNTLLVSLPGFVIGGTEFWLTVNYGGRVEPQELDREAVTVQQQSPEAVVIPPEPRFLYSHRSYWYPQSNVSDYAVAKLTITAPIEYDVVASGTALGAPATPPGVSEAGQRGKHMFVFQSERPLRYLAFVASRFKQIDTRQVDGVRLDVEANPRQAGRARSTTDRAVEIFRFYTSLAGRAPYPSFTLAFTEREVPGGHSPAYFALVDQPMQLTGLSWRGDPVNFESYPSFFVAHEIAHQWWGQAVGWKNYHEQWISEGFAQYFAVLYAEKQLSAAALSNVMRQMRQTAIKQSSEGPVYLGYRLGHIKGNTSVFRSLIYNKAAMVLHMLRRLVGDEAFFKGVREFYDESEFKKAGTGDFLKVMERVSGKDLSRFFETWIFEQRIPAVKFQHRVDGQDVVLRFEQSAPVADIPINVTVTDRAGKTTDVLVILSEALTEHRVPLSAPLRTVTANADHGALVNIRR